MSGHVVLVALRLAIVAAGALAALWSLRLGLHAREHRATYALLTFGFALFTAGSIVEGALFEFAAWDLASAHAAEAFVSASGLALVLLAILWSRV